MSLGIFRKLFNKSSETPTVSETPPQPKYSFCEAVTATDASPWHIRKLTSIGKKQGGGADTPALCGRTVSWDLATDINDHHLKYACPKCVEKYKEIA